MALICEDLARYGVVLIPSARNRHFQLAADIERRLQAKFSGLPDHEIVDSAILLNQAQVAIASIAYVWSFGTSEDDIVHHRYLPGTDPSVVLPFCLNDRTRKCEFFWRTVFPGSKRLMTADGRLHGDNTDVRFPYEYELQHGGSFSLGGGSIIEQLEPLKLTIDGVFFADGGFAGPNKLGAWEHAVNAAEAYLDCATLAREVRSTAKNPNTFFARVNELTGYRQGAPPPPPPAPSSLSDLDSIRKGERWSVGAAVYWTRERLGDEEALASIAAWAEAPAPKLHRL